MSIFIHSAASNASRSNVGLVRSAVVLLALWMFTLIGRDGGAKEPVSKPTELSSSVRSLIEQLDAPKLADRTRAEEELTKLGPDALPLLPATDLLPSLGSKQAVQRVRIRLEHEAARQSVVASRVTVSGEFSAKELAALIEQQTGNRIQVSNAISKRSELMKLAWDERPFWDAIASLKPSGLDLAFVPERGEFELVSYRPADSAPQVVTQDAFRMQLGPITTTPANKEQRLYRCPLTITAEPRLRPLFLRFAARDFVLMADSSTTLRAFDPEARVEVPLGDGGREARVELQFLGPTKVPESLVLTGEAKLLVAAAEQPIEFTKWQATRGVARRRGGVTVTLASVSVKPTAKNGSTASIQAHVSYDAHAHAFESHQTWIFHNKVYLLAPDGSRLAPNDGFESLFQNEGTVGIEYRFRDLPAASNGWKFVYLAPTLLIDVPLKLDRVRVPITAGD